MQQKEFLNACGLFQKLKQLWPHFWLYNLNNHHGFCFFMGKAFTLDEIGSRLWHNIYSSIAQFIDELRLFFIQWYCFHSTPDSFYQVRIVLDYINEKFHVPLFVDFIKARLMLYTLCQYIPEGVFKILKYNPCFHGEYQGIGWVDIVIKFELLKYNSFIEVVKDLHQIGNDYLNKMPNPNSKVILFAKTLEKSFDYMSNPTWSLFEQNKEIIDNKKYFRDCHFPIPQKSPQWYLDFYIPLIKIKVTFKEWYSVKKSSFIGVPIKEIRKQFLRQKRKQQFLTPLETNNFAEWLSEYQQAFEVEMSFIDYFKFEMEESKKLQTYLNSCSKFANKEYLKNRFIKQRKYAFQVLRFAGCKNKLRLNDIKNLPIYIREYQSYLKEYKLILQQKKHEEQEKFNTWKKENNLGHGKCYNIKYNQIRGIGYNVISLLQDDNDNDIMKISDEEEGEEESI